MKWLVLGLAVLMYVFVVIFPDKKSISALAAAAVVVVLGALGLIDVTPLYAFAVLVNWTVLMIFVGSLVIAELFIYSRMPAFIADKIVVSSPNVGIGIVAVLIMTGLISAFVENVATVLVMAPIALALCKKLKITPTYFMVGLAVMANLEGTATLVGDPPSMIFADFANKHGMQYGFNEFFFHEGRPSVFFAVQVGLLVGALFFYRFFAKTDVKKVDIECETIRSYTPTVLLILMIAGLAIASFIYHGLSPASGLIVMVLAIAGLLWYRFVCKESNSKVIELVKNLDWDTTLFLVGIFIVIGAVSGTGLLDSFADFLSKIIGDNVLLGFILILVFSTLISGFVDNVPYIIGMLPVALDLSRDLGLHPELYMFALLIGSCMGGNLTCFGASANIVSVGILRKQNVSCNFYEWLKIGAPFTVLTTLFSALFVWLVWFVWK